jgi:hypothetical protein
MARRTSKTGTEGSRIDTTDQCVLADIHSAAKSTMEPADYSSGFPAQPGVLRQGVWQGRLLNRGREE